MFNLNFLVTFAVTSMNGHSTSSFGQLSLIILLEIEFGIIWAKLFHEILLNAMEQSKCSILFGGWCCRRSVKFSRHLIIGRILVCWFLVINTLADNSENLIVLENSSLKRQQLPYIYMKDQISASVSKMLVESHALHRNIPL